MLRKTLWAGCLSLALIGFVTPCFAVTVEQVANPRQVNNGWVTDLANVLSSAAEAQINRSITALEAKNGSELAVVTVPDISPTTTPKAFATELFNRWGIGKKGQENGVLFLVSVNDRRVEVETGYGAEAILPDARVGRILDQSVVPDFRQGNYESGILSGTEALVTALEAEAASSSGVAAPQVMPFYVWIAAAGGLILAVFGYSRMMTIAHRPIEIAPEGYSRFQGSGSGDRGIYRSARWASFGILLTIAVLLWNRFAWGGTGIILLDLMPGLILGVIGFMPLSAIVTRIALRRKPHQRSIRPLHCAVTHNLMQRIPDTVLSPRLTPPEQIAQRLGSVEFEGWQCPQCYPTLPSIDPETWQRSTPTPGLHIFAYEVSHQFERCPNCQELTMQVTSRVVRPPTPFSSGVRLLSLDCQACSHHADREEIIPQTPPPVVVVGGGSGENGGGGFGGGSSGGGGAGRSW